MTEPNGSRPASGDARSSARLSDRTSEPHTTRRAFVGLVGVLTAGVGTASGSDSATTGYGVGGFGEGGFGIGGYRTAEHYADDDGIVRSDGVSDAIDDWEDGVIDMSLLLDVLDAWRSGEPVE